MKKLCLLFTIVILVSGCKTMQNYAEQMSPEYLNGVYFVQGDIHGTDAYKVYEKQYQDDRAQIEYLIHLVEHSPVTFLRNSGRYDGEQASEWLSYKYKKFNNEAQCVEDFIEKVASYSRTTGRDYYVIVGDVKCPMRAVLYNELKRLHAGEVKPQ